MCPIKLHSVMIIKLTTEWITAQTLPVKVYSVNNYTMVTADTNLSNIKWLLRDMAAVSRIPTTISLLN